MQQWVLNFMPKSVKIESLLLWVRFQILPVDYYTNKWLERVGNKIGKTIKVDRITLLASRGKFARVCVEIDTTKPLKEGYEFRGVLQEVQYEGLHELCFNRGKYGHKALICHSRALAQHSKEGDRTAKEASTTKAGAQPVAAEASTSKSNMQPEPS